MQYEGNQIHRTRKYACRHTHTSEYAIIIQRLHHREHTRMRHTHKERTQRDQAQCAQIPGKPREPSRRLAANLFLKTYPIEFGQFGHMRCIRFHLLPRFSLVLSSHDGLMNYQVDKCITRKSTQKHAICKASFRTYIAWSGYLSWPMLGLPLGQALAWPLQGPDQARPSHMFPVMVVRYG